MATKPLLRTKSKEKKEAGDATTNKVDGFDKIARELDPSTTKIDYDTTLNYGMIKFVSRVKKCADDAEDIDIYQYLAFKWETWRDTKNEKWYDICRLTHEVLMCILAQIIGVVVILKQVIEDGVEVKDSCNESAIQVKLLAFALSSVAGYVAMEVFVHEKGMYTGGIGDCRSWTAIHDLIEVNITPPHWVSLFWLGVGTWVNRIVSIGAVGGSFMVIFFSENAFDMVLNSVALFFLMELDNMLMTQPKYNDMLMFLKAWPEDVTDTYNDLIKDMEQIDIEWLKDEQIANACVDKYGEKDFLKLARPAISVTEKKDTSKCCSCMVIVATIFNLCCFGCYAFFGVFFVIACVVVPVYIGVCY
eukprot:48011_1